MSTADDIAEVRAFLQQVLWSRTVPVVYSSGALAAMEALNRLSARIDLSSPTVYDPTMQPYDEPLRHADQRVARAEIVRLMREDFDPTPPGWEGRDWDDNAEDVADKIVAVAMSAKPAHASDAWRIVKQWLSDYAAEEQAFSRYRDDVVLDGTMTACLMRRLNAALRDVAEIERLDRAAAAQEDRS